MLNPLIRLELMRRFRSPFAAWGIPLVVLLPGLSVLVVYGTTVRGSTSVIGGMQGGVAPGDLDGVGVGMFVAVVIALFITLGVLVPAMVGGSIAGERHSQTLQPLQLTAMSPNQIVIGKLVSSLGYLLLALVCAAPVVAIPYLLGGLTIDQLVATYVSLFLVTLEFAALSLAISAVMSRPAPAIILALLACGALTFLPWVVMGIGFAISASSDAFFDASVSRTRYASTFSPLALGSWSLGRFTDDHDIGDVYGAADQVYRVLSVIWFLLITVGSLWIAKVKVTAPVEKDR